MSINVVPRGWPEEELETEAQRSTGTLEPKI